MSEWIMPGWEREIWEGVGYQSISMHEMYMSDDGEPQFQHRVAHCIQEHDQKLRDANLLLTPAERDAQEKRVRELEELLREIFESVSDTNTHDVPILFNFIIADDQLYAWHAKAEKALNAGGENEENCTTGGS